MCSVYMLPLLQSKNQLKSLERKIISKQLLERQIEPVSPRSMLVHS